MIIFRIPQAIALTEGKIEAVAASITVVGSDVYVAGTEYSGSAGGVAEYWKNGKAVRLTDGTKDGFASTITVVGSDIYVAGNEVSGFQYIQKRINLTLVLCHTKISIK